LEFLEEVLRVFLQIAQLHRRGKEATKQFLHARVGDRIKRKAIQGCGVVFGATHPEEFTFPTLVRVLEEGEENSASDSGKAHPEAFPLLFHFKEMKENVH